MRRSWMVLAFVPLAACSTSHDASSPDASALPDGGCRATSDCHAGICLSPGQDFLPTCGGPPPRYECATSADCVKPTDAGAEANADAGAPDVVCQPADCSGSRCQGRCVTDGDCPPAAIAPSVCDAATGICLRAKCNATSCGSDAVCNPAVGCSPKRCTADAECTGACVNGTCVSGIGHCSFPPPPPP